MNLTRDQILKLEGQELADACAVMMGWKRDKEWRNPSGWKVNRIKWMDYRDWYPHLIHSERAYSQCRIIEEWILENGLWKSFLSELSQFNKEQLCSTSIERCRAALLAEMERNKIEHKKG